MDFCSPFLLLNHSYLQDLPLNTLHEIVKPGPHVFLGCPRIRDLLRQYVDLQICKVAHQVLVVRLIFVDVAL
jgi:hypothetical protein